MKHEFYKSGDGEHACNDMGECMVCSLSVCKVCGGAEGSLTTDCCGEKMGYEKSEQVYSGRLDFRNGEWVNKLGPSMQSCIQVEIFKSLGKREGYLTESEIIIKYGIDKEEYREIRAVCLKHLDEYENKKAQQFRERQEYLKKEARKHLQVMK